MDSIQFLKNLIKENKPEITLEILCALFKDHNEVNNQLILVTARLRNIKNKFNIGVGDKDLEKEYLKTNDSILNIIDQYADYCTALHIPNVKISKNEIGRYESSLWRFVTIMNTKKDYEYFLSKYPQSIFTSLAQYAIQNIEEDYLEGTVLVHLTSNATERFEIGALANFGQFTDVISKIIYPFVNNNRYGQEWVLELGHDSNVFLKHGRMIVEDYHSEKVKDVRSLWEMGINDGSKLTVKKIEGDKVIDNEIYSDVIADYEKNICQEIIRLNDIPEDIRVGAELKLKGIENARIHIYFTNNKIGESLLITSKGSEKKGEEGSTSQKPNLFFAQMDKDGILLKITYLILWAFLPILLYLFFETLFWRQSYSIDTFIYLFMIGLLLASVLAMRNIKNKWP